VLSDFKDEQAVLLTGGASKKWYRHKLKWVIWLSHVAWADPNFGTQIITLHFYGAQPNES
jgi:hypothetical protein